MADASPLAERVKVLNHLQDAAVSQYFDVREHESYYRAIKHAAPRRDFHTFLIPVCKNFVSIAMKPENERLIDSVIAEAQRIHDSVNTTRPPEGRHARPSVGKSPVPDQAIGDRLRGAHPDGFRLLELESPFTYSRLRDAYRTAAKRHHPDAGGANDRFILINEAHAFFAHVLSAIPEPHTPEVAAAETIAVQEHRTQLPCCHDFRCGVGLMMFEAALDDWSLEAAFEWLRRLRTIEWRLRQPSAEEDRAVQLVEPTAKLAARLVAARKRAEAVETLEFAEACLRVATARGPYYTRLVNTAQRVVAGRAAATVVLNHPRQIENAYAVGVIDRSRYTSLMHTHPGAARGQARTEQNLAAYLAEQKFLWPLESDRCAIGKTAMSRLVPEPGYGEVRLVALTDDQQSEYADAFSRKITAHGVKKYLFVRLMSLLETVILSDPPFDPPRRRARMSVPFVSVRRKSRFMAGDDSRRYAISPQMKMRRTDASDYSSCAFSTSLPLNVSGPECCIDPHITATCRPHISR